MSAGAGFFCIDRRIWKILCGRSGAEAINAAVSYLTIAAGTGRSNLVSKWSANAVETFTGLHSSRGKTAINSLLAEGYLMRRPKSSRTRPIYELQSFPDVLEAARTRLIAESELGRSIIECALRGSKVAPTHEKFAARMVLGGTLWKRGGRFCAEPPAVEEGANLIWLPNSLVTGTDRGEQSPIKRLRSRGDMWALRLLIDLYHAQNLSADGGISRTVLRHPYGKQKCGEYGRHIVWEFSRGEYRSASRAPSTEAFWEFAEHNKTANGESAIWRAIESLEELGLLVEIPHLVENSSRTCEPIHGLSWDGKGEPEEQELADAAVAAGRYLLTKDVMCGHVYRVGMTLVPVWDTLPDVQVIGVFRLRYRPQTSLTADWYRRHMENAAAHLKIYREIGPPAVKVWSIRDEDW